MADVPALLKAVLERLRAVLPDVDRTAHAVLDALADDALRPLAEDVLQAERKAHGALEAPEIDAWDSMAESFAEALKVDPGAASDVVRSALAKRLKIVAAS